MHTWELIYFATIHFWIFFKAYSMPMYITMFLSAKWELKKKTVFFQEDQQNQSNFKCFFLIYKTKHEISNFSEVKIQIT